MTRERKQRVRHYLTQEQGVSLRDYLEIQIDGIKESIVVANTEMNRRLEGMNEFRAQLEKQATFFMSTAEFMLFKEQVDRDLKEIFRFRDELAGKDTQHSMEINKAVAMTAIAVGLIGMVVGTILRFFKV